MRRPQLREPGLFDLIDVQFTCMETQAELNMERSEAVSLRARRRHEYRSVPNGNNLSR